MYEEYLKSPHWIAVKTAMFARYKRCQLCGKGHDLNVHHVRGYDTLGMERLGIDVVLVCKKCHHLCHFTYMGRKIALTEYELTKRYRFLMRTRHIRNFRLGSSLNTFFVYIFQGLMK